MRLERSNLFWRFVIPVLVSPNVTACLTVFRKILTKQLENYGCITFLQGRLTV